MGGALVRKSEQRSEQQSISDPMLLWAGYQSGYITAFSLPLKVEECKKIQYLIHWALTDSTSSMMLNTRLTCQTKHNPCVFLLLKRQQRKASRSRKKISERFLFVFFLRSESVSLCNGSETGSRTGQTDLCFVSQTERREQWWGEIVVRPIWCCGYASDYSS